MRSLTPIRRTVEERARANPDLRDVFLCHAWDDRRGTAKELHDLLESNDVSVWFSEKDVELGKPLLRAIDRGLAKSRADTAEDSMADIAVKIGELADVQELA